MLLRAVQRLVRSAPNATRALWERVPERARRALAPMLFPVAAGRRGGGFVLDAPDATVLPARAYDVVVSAGVPFDGTLREWVSAERAAGCRVFTASHDEAERVVRAEHVLDGIYVAAPDEPETSLAPLRRLGLRVVAAADVVRGAAPFPSVSVVIPTRDAAPLLAVCLSSLRRNTPWPNLEVVVVDNGSRDGTREVLAAHAGVVVLQNADNRGFAPAINQGLERARGEIAVLLNDDTAVGPGWLSRLVAHLEADPRLGLVCPVTNEIGNRAKIPVTYRTYADMEAFATARAFEHAGERCGIQTVALFCAAARRGVLAEVGFLDERYAVGMFEDDDLSRTLARAGYERAVAADAFVHHVGHASFGKLPDAEYLAIWQANRRRFEAKWGVRWAPPEPPSDG
jgi:GT2 family glycosyltransferase